jgi:hypothetical protein
MKLSRVEEIADTFWRDAGGRAGYGAPVNIAAAVSVALPAAVVRIDGLHTETMRRLISRIGASPWDDLSPRPLRGCLIADGGHAFILVDGSDDPDEQRMTVAHEAAHLIVHYFGPRARAVAALGGRIRAVLDRTRSPTSAERLSSALAGVAIQPFRHAMDRGDRHGPRVRAMEDEADQLGVELIAPWREIRAAGIMEPAVVRRRFGLPAAVAARMAGATVPKRPSIGVLGIFDRK